MNGYLQRLTAASAEFPAVESRILLLTGQSSFASSALSPAQHSFLDAVTPPGFAVERTGFPFDASFARAGFRNIGMASASARNAKQVYWSMYSSEFVAVLARRLQLLLHSTSQRLILITGSCGLQLANVAWPRLQVPVALAVNVVALGPASFEPPRMRATVVQGRRDAWSRLFYKGRVDHVCECGHLMYWESQEVRTLVRGILR